MTHRDRLPVASTVLLTPAQAATLAVVLTDGLSPRDLVELTALHDDTLRVTIGQAKVYIEPDGRAVRANR